MSLALRQFGWPPAEVWQVTPRELFMAVDALSRSRAAPNRQQVDALMSRFPDQGTDVNIGRSNKNFKETT